MKIARPVLIVFVCALTAIIAGAQPAWSAEGGERGNRGAERGRGERSKGASRAARRPQDPRASRTGRIQNLGEYEAAILWDNRAQLTLKGSDFEFTKRISQGGEFEIVLRGGRDEGDLTISMNHLGITVEKAGQIVAFDRTSGEGAFRDQLEQVRQMIGGRAVTAFRSRIGAYERRLLKEDAAQSQPLLKKERFDEPYGMSLLLSGALVAELAGDPSALERTRELIRRRILSRLQVIRARYDMVDCVTEYERYLLAIDTQLSQCLDAADSRDTWYARAADRLGCHAEYIARAESGLLQFTACSTVKLIA